MSFFKSLSFRLLILTVFFVMVAEVLIYSPSIGRFRLVYLEQKLANAQLAVLSIRTQPDAVIDNALSDELLDHVGAYRVVVARKGERMHILARADRPKVDAEFNLANHRFFPLIIEAFSAISQTGNRVIKVTGPSPKAPDVEVTVEIDEAPMRAEMFDYSWRILALSLGISFFTAALVFLSLRWILVTPMARITRSMVAFRENPEDRSSDLFDDGRADEIGVTLRELSSMKSGLRSALREQTRLAALGTAVSKINHDLRNMLSTATLISDRLAMSSDPNVQKAAPPLIRSIDRAVNLCSQTLNFSQGTPPLDLESVPLVEVLGDMKDGFEASSLTPLSVTYDENDTTVLCADRDQIFRVFANLMGNASSAGASEVTVRARSDAHRVTIELADNGPGIPEEAHARLFLPFRFTTKKDGSGLGLAISRDIAQAHGGDLSLGRTGPEGTVFVLVVPAA
ncbi:MAG: HAMP domain-containing histidine kinase [Rhodospirillaceae bacterium]|nr:HAMP domain-containing histidine kinase [Rhodospirillaceae bacterium]